MAKSVLRWDDEDFWDSSPRFLFKQFDLYVEFNKPSKDKAKTNKPGVETKEIKTKLKVLDYNGE